jgi:hypothetical protein
MDYVRPLQEVLRRGAWHNEGAPGGRRAIAGLPANPWPLGQRPLLG